MFVSVYTGLTMWLRIIQSLTRSTCFVHYRRGLKARWTAERLSAALNLNQDILSKQEQIGSDKATLVQSVDDRPMRISEYSENRSVLPDFATT